MSKITKPIFVLLVSSSRSLTALDDCGNVWTYIGNKYGWRPLNMRRLTIKEAMNAADEKEKEHDI